MRSHKKLEKENKKLKEWVDRNQEEKKVARRRARREKEWDNPCPICNDIMGGIVCNTFGEVSCGKCSINIMMKKQGSRS